MTSVFWHGFLLFLVNKTENDNCLEDERIMGTS